MGELAGGIASSIFFLTVGAVILLRPVAVRLGEYLEVLIAEKRRQDTALDGLRNLSVEAQQDLLLRLSQVEKRLDWTESLLDTSSQIETTKS